MPYEYEREHFRVVYPTAARPRFVIGEVVHDVVDLSELGIRYRLVGQESAKMGGEVGGVLRLRRGAEVRISGKVLRVVGREVAMRLTLGVPLRVILEEQRYLRERHRGMAW